MKFLLALIVLSLSAFFCFGQEKQKTKKATNVSDITINGKYFIGDYKVFLFLDNKWFETVRSSSGFKAKKKIKDEESVKVRFVFGNYSLDFPKIHKSMFNTKWRIGVYDNPPFPAEYVSSGEDKSIKRIYYIKFESEDYLNKTLLVTEPK
jgi:hypothetical protein